MEFHIMSVRDMVVVSLDKYSLYYFISIFWGLILALISLPFYLAGIGIPEIGKKMGIDTFILFVLPTSAAFLTTTILSDRDMIYSMVSIISAMVFLSTALSIFLAYPALIGAVIFTGDYYVLISKHVFFGVLIMFPSFLIGGIFGKIFGEYFISEQTRKEREELNKRMREWKETLEKVLEEKRKEEEAEKKKREKINP